MKNLYILRHGVTALNAQRKAQGRINEPLSLDGIKQAQKVAAYFKETDYKFDKVYSSPLSRATDTARIVSGTDPIIVDELIEQDYGSLDGTDYEPTKKYKCNFKPFGGENQADVAERYDKALRNILKENGDNILVVGHGSAIRAFCLSTKEEIDLSHIPNCALFHFLYDGEKFYFKEIISKGE